jgi:KDO2-lipid IV(A) lauroyltransferase
VFFFLALGRIRRALASNLEPVLGPANGWQRWHRSFRTIWAFSWCFAERYRRLVNPERFHTVVEGESNWRRVMDSPGGTIVVTAHLGPWENAAYAGASESPRRVHVVREKEIDPRAQTFVSELLARAGGHYVVHFAGDDLALSLELSTALRNGEIVALQADRPRAGGRSVVVSLFGRPMPLPIGPAALARVAGVPILPVFTFREGRFHMRVVARAPFEVARTRNREADIAGAVHHLAAEIEWAIRERPHQWFCFRRLWDER